MKKLTVIVAVLLMSLVVVTPAFAYAGVDGQVIDSLDKNPWTYGGEIWVYNTSTGAVYATCVLDATGDFDDAGDPSPDGLCDYGDNALGYGTIAAAPGFGTSITILIDYTCSSGSGCSPPANGTPGNYSHQYNEAPPPGYYNTGYIETGTGPTAITLVNATAASANVWLPVGLAVLALAVVGAVVVRRRR
jgi:hypothetical protein